MTSLNQPLRHQLWGKIPTLSRYVFTGVGIAIILMAATVFTTGENLENILTFLDEVFGPVFIALYVSTVGVALYSWSHIRRNQRRQYWLEVGQQASAFVATIALTFTLMGISLGIRGLADQDLNPDTVQEVIAGLSSHFSTAFLTTVIGLPTAALLRALLSITNHNQLEKE